LKAQRKKHEIDDAEKLKDYEEMRRIQREKDEEELRQLKEKQVHNNLYKIMHDLI